MGTVAKLREERRTGDGPALVALDSLHFGHDYPGADIHARRSERDTGLAQLAASIKADGLLQSLLGCHSPDVPGEVYVIAGNRRLAALQMLYAEGAIGQDYLVPVLLREDVTPGTALALSLAESICQVPLHPIDRYEAFAAIGGEPAEIAARFGTSEKIVRQSLALGNLSPKIRDAWRAGDIGADVAQAFTLAKDIKDQEKHFAALKKQHRLSSYAVREHIIGDQRDVEHLVVFVGKEAYEAAGGTVVEDLFGEKHGVSDVAKLTALANERLEAECKRLVAEGWEWAEPRARLPADYHHAWRRASVEPKFTADDKKRLKDIEARMTALEEDYSRNAVDETDRLDNEHSAIHRAAKLRGFSEADKRDCGCAVDINDDGTLDIEPGLMMPKKIAKAVEEKGYIETVDEKTGEVLRELPSAPAAKKKKKKAANGEAEISQALGLDLGRQLTHAAADAIALEPELAIAAMLAAIACEFAGDSPVRIALNGMYRDELKLSQDDDFAANFKRYAKLKLADQAKLLARCAAATLMMSALTEGERSIEDRVLLDAMDGKALNAALRKRFDAQRYFDGVPKALCLAAIREAVGEDEARRVASKPKGEVAACAVQNYGAWLPPELRTAHYDGPAAKAKAKAAGKAKGKKGARK